MNHTSRDMSKLFNNLRKEEENSFPSNSFTGSIAKVYKYGLLGVSIAGIVMAYFLTVHIQDLSVGMVFGIIGIIALLMLPTYFSYGCYVDKSIIEERYYILCFKIRKEIRWQDIKYKIVKRDSDGNAYSIRLYSIRKKKLISFNYEIAGFGKIVRMAKGVPVLKR